MVGVAFRNGWPIDKLLLQLNTVTELNSEGNISFKTLDNDDLFFLLADGVAHPDNVTRNDVSEISRRSFLDLRKNGAVKKQPLISEISKRIAERIRAPRHKYTMWTKCRLSQMSFAKSSRFEVEGVSIRTAPHLPKWLKLNEHFVSGIGCINPNILPFFGYIIFSVEARNENEAAKKMFAACDLFFAIVNTCWRSIELYIQRSPSAKMWIGPHQFFFENRRFLGEHAVWSNQNYDEAKWKRYPKSANEFNGQTRLIRRIIKSLAEHPLRSELNASLLLIGEGMISDDLAFRLMRFWSAAEALYAPGEDKTPMRKIISRLTFASKSNRWLDQMKLERCYHLRNMYAHRGSNESDNTSLVQHLRELLLHQIYYYLWHGQDIESHADMLMMVDLPVEKGALERRKLAINRRLNIARSGRHRI